MIAHSNSNFIPFRGSMAFFDEHETISWNTGTFQSLAGGRFSSQPCCGAVGDTG
jgi:hypothetical protein